MIDTQATVQCPDTDCPGGRPKTTIQLTELAPGVLGWPSARCATCGYEITPRLADAPPDPVAPNILGKL